MEIFARWSFRVRDRRGHQFGFAHFENKRDERSLALSLDKVFIFDNKLMIRSRFERGVWKDKQVVTKPAKQTYNRYFSFYKAPRKGIKNLISIQRKFLWQGVSEENKICWVSYKMFLPKSKGGLGVKDLQYMIWEEQLFSDFKTNVGENVLQEARLV